MQAYEGIEDDDDAIYREYQRQYYENSNKNVYFLLRDSYLITKVSITGTVVF